MKNDRTRRLLLTLTLTAVLGTHVSTQAAGAELPGPAAFFANRANNLGLLPDGFIATRPIQLAIAFNLKSPPNSAGANGFLKQLQTSLLALPEKMELKLYRHVTPTKFQYTVTMTFPNWGEYVAHEKSEAFLQYYRQYWKPEVAEAEERLYVVDDETMR